VGVTLLEGPHDFTPRVRRQSQNDFPVQDRTECGNVYERAAEHGMRAPFRSIRSLSKDGRSREFSTIAAALQIQHIGNVETVWRPRCQCTARHLLNRLSVVNEALSAVTKGRSTTFRPDSDTEKGDGHVNIAF
jgi:hypothetical protein